MELGALMACFQCSLSQMASVSGTLKICRICTTNAFRRGVKPTTKQDIAQLATDETTE